VFLFLGMAMFPLTVFCRYVLGVRHDAADPLIALLVLFPAGFVFSGAPRQLPPALQSPLFIPHVMTYLLGYVVMVKAGLIAYRIMRRPQPMTPSTGASITLPVAMDRLVRLGFPLLTAGLLLGAVWGKLAWGDWWNWDPKEMWSLATWLVFVLYFHLSAGTASRVRLRAAVVVAGVALVIITLLWVNLSRIFAGLHNYAT
jgi:ABC-type transport system involved in cytochrome c biogenesis permease subunit